MTLYRRESGPVQILELVGRLTGAEAAVLVEDALITFARDSTRTLIVDLARVHRVDEQGAAALVNGHRSIRRRGGELRLAGMTRDLGERAVLTTLATSFNVFDSVDEAIDGAISVASAFRRTPKAV